MKPHFNVVDPHQVEELRAFAKRYQDCYATLNQPEIPQVIPLQLRQKCPAALAMSSTGGDGTVVFVVNLLREDLNDHNSPFGALDQQPFGLAFLPNGNLSSTVYVDHGGWAGRTEYMTSTGIIGLIQTIMPQTRLCLKTPNSYKLAA
jgi:hypothetical protein